MKSIKVTPEIPLPQKSSAELAVEGIEEFTLNSFRQSVEIQRAGIRRFWEDPNATPQEIANEYGANAAALFRDHGTWTALVVKIATDNGINPMTGKDADGNTVASPILLPPFAWTEHEDGTVTILETPYVPA